MVLSSADISFSKSFFWGFFSIFYSVIPVECPAVWIQIMPISLNCLQRLSAGGTSKKRVYDDNSSKLES